MKGPTFLIIGIAGGLKITAQLLSDQFPECTIIGIDNRDLSHLEPIPNTEFKKISYSRNQFEKLFREYRFDYVYHLGRITHTRTQDSHQLEKRFEIHIIGTKIILDLCLKFKVKKIILLSSFHVYGALGDNPVFIPVDFPLRASLNYPELRDLVEMDQLATNWMWQHQNKIQMVVLRPCNIIGPQIKNAMTKYLCSSWTPYPVDYKPMFQFIHEFDMANILIRTHLEVPTGVYNVAPEEFISIGEARNIVGKKGTPVSMYLTALMASFLKKSFPLIPDYLIEYLKYSCLIDGRSLNQTLGRNHFRYTISETLQLLNIN